MMTEVLTEKDGRPYPRPIDYQGKPNRVDAPLIGAKVRNGAKTSRRDRVDLGHEGIQIICPSQHLTPTYVCRKSESQKLGTKG